MNNFQQTNFGGGVPQTGFNAMSFGGSSMGFGGSTMSGCGCNAFSPSSMGFGSSMGGFGTPAMGGFGASPMGISGAMGDPMQQMLSSAMSMMSQMMMLMMTQMMSNIARGGVAMPNAPGQFGGPSGLNGGGLNGGSGGGSPLDRFLGGAQKAGKANKKSKKSSGPSASGGGGSSASGASESAGPSTKMDANGKVGDVNVEKLINAIPSSYRENAKKHWPSIVAEAQKQGVKNKASLAYILATTVHESGAGKYMEEIASGSAYEGRRDLGNTHSGDGVRYKGRGYVQITGRNNYTKWGKKLGLNLVGNPELAERPATAAKILVGGMKEGSFTGKGLDDYFGGGKADFTGARAIVNGSDKAGTFAATAKAILAAMS